MFMFMILPLVGNIKENDRKRKMKEFGRWIIIKFKGKTTMRNKKLSDFGIDIWIYFSIGG